MSITKSSGVQVVLPAATTATPATALTTSVQSFSAPLAGYLQHHSLPTENVFIPVQERRMVIDSRSRACPTRSARRRTT